MSTRALLVMFYFSNKIRKGKIKFCSVNADTKTYVPRRQCQDFQMAFKMCSINNHNNVAQKLKEMTDIHPNKIESEKNIHINKQ